MKEMFWVILSINEASTTTFLLSNTAVMLDKYLFFLECVPHYDRYVYNLFLIVDSLEVAAKCLTRDGGCPKDLPNILNSLCAK